MTNKEKMIANEIGSNKSNLIFLLLLLATTLTTVSCVRHSGSFEIGRPMALSPAKTANSLKSQQGSVTDKVALASINPFKINQGHFFSSNLSQKGKIAIAPTGPDASNPSTGDVSQQDFKSAEPIVKVSAPDFSGLVGDGFTNLESFSAHKIDVAEDFDIDSIVTDGEEGELFKLKFDIWVEPEHQDYLTYIWRWVTGFQNYTKDYHAEFLFSIKGPPKGTAEVILVQPVHEGINSYEMALLQKTSQLAVGGGWQAIAAELDLAERHREQLIQQRKNPIIRGVIGPESTFRYIISPRQYVTQRSFRIPFLMSRYSIERGLESGPYPVSAYVLIKDEELTKLQMMVCGYYKKFGDAHRSGEDDGIGGKDRKDHCKEFEVKLPRGEVAKATVSKERPNLIYLSWGNRQITALDTNSECDTDNEKEAKARLVYNETGINHFLKGGMFNNKEVFWIESNPFSASKEKTVTVEFCSNGIKRRSKPVTYIAEKKYQSAVSIGKNLVKGSSSGSEVKISILGVPGETIELKNIRFGNLLVDPLGDDAKESDLNGEGHILEFKTIVPEYKDKKTKIVSIIVTVITTLDGSTKIVPLNVEQSFAIDHNVGSVAQIDMK